MGVSKQENNEKTRELKNYDYFGISDTGEVRDDNQDRFAYFETINGDIIIICDGVGGSAHGEIAAEICIETVRKFFTAEWHQDLQQATINSLKESNKQVRIYYSLNPEEGKPATTVVFCIIRENQVYYAHVGDSRMYLCVNNKLFRATTDHSYVQDLLRDKKISKSEAENHPQKNIITRAIGAEESVEIEFCKKHFSPFSGNSVLLCTDGLTSMLNDKEIEKIINRSENARICCENLVRQANQNGGKDNVTVQFIKFYNIERPQTEKNQNQVTKFKQGKFLLIVSILIILIFGYPLISYIYTETIGNSQDSGFIETTPIKEEIISYRKDTIILLYFKKNENIENRLKNLNLDPKLIIHGTGNENEFLRYYVPVKAVYKVKPADKLEIIGNIFDISIQSILRANQKEDLFILPGEKIIIPLKEEKVE